MRTNKADTPYEGVEWVRPMIRLTRSHFLCVQSYEKNSRFLTVASLIETVEVGCFGRLQTFMLGGIPLKINAKHHWEGNS